MSFALLFAVLMILWFIWGIIPGAPYGGPAGIGSHVLLFILFLLLGWRVFGPLIHP